jgi:hypothetical protein
MHVSSLSMRNTREAVKSVSLSGMSTMAALSSLTKVPKVSFAVNYLICVQYAVSWRWFSNGLFFATLKEPTFSAIMFLI